jgi:hypothetical protein
MSRRSCIILALWLAGFASSALADTLYIVTVDTSTIQGTAGSLDIEFNPGNLGTAQDASLGVLVFASDGTLAGSPQTMGDVTGALPGTLTFDNQMAFNDYFEGFTYGTTLTFDVSLSGPAIDSPDGLSTSGSQFVFSMFSDAAGTVPALTTDSTFGIAFTIDVNLDGSTSVTDNSMQTTIAPSPEPGTLALFGSGIALCAVLRLRRSGSRNW